MDDICIGLQICRGKPSLIKGSQAVTVLALYDDHCSCHSPKLCYRSSKSRAHITVANSQGYANCFERTCTPSIPSTTSLL